MPESWRHRRQPGANDGRAFRARVPGKWPRRARCQSHANMMLCAYDSACWRHGGTNVQSVVQACGESRLAGQPALIISNNRDSALEFGRSRGIPSIWIGGAAYADQALRDHAICTQLLSHDVDVVLLLGYMRKLGPATLGCFRNRVFNIHPALLTKHGGRGKYGIHVHESVLASGDTETGVSIHSVDAEYDQGPVVAQCRVPVLNGDTPATLQARVLARSMSSC